MGAVGVTDNPAINAPLNAQSHTTFVPLGDLEQVEHELATGEYCAVIIEGIQGVGGIQIPDDNFLRELRRLTTQYNTCLILDEVQSGYGRTGRFFAHQWAGIRPDLITMAKGMGNGFPVGGVLISPMFQARTGMLGTTFGGSHLACAAAIAVLQVIEEGNLVDNALEVGNYLMERLHQLPQAKDIRGRGLMVGFDVEESASEVRRRLVLEQHVFTGGAGQHTVRILPALNVSKKEIDLFIERFESLKV